MRIRRNQNLSSLKFSKNFPGLFPKPGKYPILYDIFGAIVSILVGITNLLGLGGVVGIATLEAVANVLVLGIAIGASYAISALTRPGKPNIGAGGAPTSTMQTGILVNGRNVSDPIKLCYGQCRIGGNVNLIHSCGEDNRMLHVMVDWGEGPIEGFVTDGQGNKIWMDDKRVQYYENYEGFKLVYYNLQYGTLKKKDYTTKIKTQASAGSYSIDVLSTSRMKRNEDIGIILDDSSEHWTYIDSITDSDTVVIHDAIPTGRYAPVNALVYTIQVVDANAAAVLSNYIETYRGTAYSHFRLIYHPEAWASFPLITAELKFRRIKDTRTGDIAWSNNRALVVYDYMISKIYGMRIPESLIDQTSVNDAATWCDDNGYTFDGPYTERNESGDILHDLMGPRMDYIWSGGKIKFIVFKDDAAALVLNEDDIIVRSLQGHIPGIPETPTRMKIWFFDALDNYSRKSIYVEQAEGVIYPATEDDERTPEIVIYGITDFEKLSKVAKYAFMRARFNKTFSVTGKARCIAIEPGDMVAITHSFPKWTNKKLRAIKVGIPQSGEIPMIIQEEDSSIYNPVVDVTVHYPYQSTLPGSQQSLNEPTNLAVTTGPDEQTVDNKYDSYLEFQWDFKGKGHNYDLRYKKTNVAKWTHSYIKAPHGDVSTPVKTGTGTMGMIATGDAYPTADKNYKCEIDGDYTTLIRIQANAGATTIQVNSTSKFYVGQLIGITLDDSTIHWSTISTIVDADTITITTGIPTGRYAPINAYIYPQTFKWSDSGGTVWNATAVPVRASNHALLGYILVFDSTVTNQTHQANNATAGDMDFMDSTPAIDDTIYFIGAKMYNEIDTQISIQGVGVWDGIWEYWNGLIENQSYPNPPAPVGWTPINITLDEIQNFRAAAGLRKIKFSMPADWDKCVVGGINGFAIRYRLISYTSMATRPKGSWAQLWRSADWCDLNNNIKVSFDALKGAVIGDYWTFIASCPNPVKKRVGSLPCNTIFEWQIRSTNPDGRKSEFIVGPQITSWAPDPPPDVSFVDANCNFDTVPYFYWNAVSPQPLYYEIRSEDANWGLQDDKLVVIRDGKYKTFLFNNFIQWADILGLTEAQRRNITFYIKAKNKGNVYSANADSITLANTAPSMSGYSPTCTPHLAGKHVIVNWASWSGITLPDIVKYNVYCSTEAQCTITAANLKKTVAANVHQTEITVLSKNIQYDFRVVPWDMYGEGVPSN